MMKERRKKKKKGKKEKKMKILILDNKIQVCFSARESGKKKKTKQPPLRFME